MTNLGAWAKGRHDFDPATKHDMRSVSKSVTSLLVGIAIDRELIKSADEPVVKFFPDYSAVKTTGWDHITLRHLLTMSSGIPVGRKSRLEGSGERRAASRQRGRPVPLCPVEADRGAAGTCLELQWRRDGSARQRHRARLGQAAGSFAREALFDAPRHFRLGVDEATATSRSPRPRVFACARATPPRSASSCSTRAPGTASRSSRPSGSSNRSRRASRRIGYFGGLFYLRPAMVDGPYACPATRT